MKLRRRSRCNRKIYDTESRQLLRRGDVLVMMMLLLLLLREPRKGAVGRIPGKDHVRQGSANKSFSLQIARGSGTPLRGCRDVLRAFLFTLHRFPPCFSLLPHLTSRRLADEIRIRSTVTRKQSDPFISHARPSRHKSRSSTLFASTALSNAKGRWNVFFDIYGGILIMRGFTRAEGIFMRFWSLEFPESTIHDEEPTKNLIYQRYL